MISNLPPSLIVIAEEMDDEVVHDAAVATAEVLRECAAESRRALLAASRCASALRNAGDSGGIGWTRLTAIEGLLQTAERALAAIEEDPC